MVALPPGPHPPATPLHRQPPSTTTTKRHTRYGNDLQWDMALTPAERQRRFRARHAAGEPVRRFETVAIHTRRTRPQRWAAAVQELRAVGFKSVAWFNGGLFDNGTALFAYSRPLD